MMTEITIFSLCTTLTVMTQPIKLMTKALVTGLEVPLVDLVFAVSIRLLKVEISARKYNTESFLPFSMMLEMLIYLAE